MGPDETVMYLIVGGFIGFVLGYITRLLQEIRDKNDAIKEELDEVDEIVKTKLKRQRDESGIVRKPLLADILLLVVVVITVWAAFASQKASNDVKADQKEDDAVQAQLVSTQDDLKTTQAQLAQVTTCNQIFLGRTIRALNERTTYTVAQTNSNVQLQKAQARFFGILLGIPPPSEEESTSEARAYLDKLNEFVKVSEKSAAKALTNPYPTNEDLTTCLFLDPEEETQDE